MVKVGDILNEDFGNVVVTKIDTWTLEDGTEIVVITAEPEIPQ